MTISIEFDLDTVDSVMFYRHHDGCGGVWIDAICAQSIALRSRYDWDLSVDGVTSIGRIRSNARNYGGWWEGKGDHKPIYEKTTLEIIPGITLRGT